MRTRIAATVEPVSQTFQRVEEVLHHLGGSWSYATNPSTVCRFIAVSTRAKLPGPWPQLHEQRGRERHRVATPAEPAVRAALSGRDAVTAAISCSELLVVCGTSGEHW